jgi:hypothetical protein
MLVLAVHYNRPVNRSRGYSVFHFVMACSYIVSRVSSVSIVSGYGLDDRAIEVRSPAAAKGFFL